MAKQKSKELVAAEAKISELEAPAADLTAKLAAADTELATLRADKPERKPAPKNGSREQRSAEVLRLASERGLSANHTATNTWQIDGPEGYRGILDYWQNRQE